MPGLYFIAQILIILLSFALIYFLLRGLNYAFSRLNFSAIKQKKLSYFIGAGLVFWLGILATFSFLGFFDNFKALPPRIAFAVILPLILIITLLISKPFFKVIAQIPPAWLIYIQSFRIPMEIILWLGFIGGFIPFQMTFEGFNYDIVVGITALIGGFVFFARGRFLRLEAFIWNIFGIILLLNIVIISTISTPAPFRIFTNEPANTFIAAFPFIWIPGFIVPIALAMHLFSIKQIWHSKKLPKHF